jgi:hypothetical protein
VHALPAGFTSFNATIPPPSNSNCYFTCACSSIRVPSYALTLPFAAREEVDVGGSSVCAAGTYVVMLSGGIVSSGSSNSMQIMVMNSEDTGGYYDYTSAYVHQSCMDCNARRVLVGVRDVLFRYKCDYPYACGAAQVWFSYTCGTSDGTIVDDQVYHSKASMISAPRIHLPLNNQSMIPLSFHTVDPGANQRRWFATEPRVKPVPDSADSSGPETQ